MDLGILTVGNESHLLQAECTETCCRVRLKENLIIPTQHEVRLVGMLHRTQANSVSVKQGLLQPTASLVEETGFFMGNSLVDTSGPLVPVTLLNLDEEPKSLNRGFTVGLMEQVEGAAKGETTSPQTLEAGPEKSQIEHLLPLDLASGYWQVPVAPADRDKTAFTTQKGLFEWKVMPFGLSNAPPTFSRLMELVLLGLHWECCLVYLDDIVVFGRNFEQALENLELVFD